MALFFLLSVDRTRTPLFRSGDNNMMTKYLYLGLFIMAPAIAFGDCPNVRIDQTALKNVPILDQDGSGLCWAYTASTMIDAYRFSHGDPNTEIFTSPVALATKANAKEKLKLSIFGETMLVLSNKPTNAKNGYGTPTDALDIAKSDGYVCNHKVVSRHFPVTNFALFEKDVGKSYTIDEIDTECLPYWKQILAGAFPSLAKTAHEMKQVSLLTASLSLDKLCTDKNIAKIKIPNAKMELLDPRSNEPKPIERMKSLLGRPNPQPVGITYCPNVLRDPKQTAIDSRGRFACDNPHLSAVVGGRTGPSGECEYLIRNSYGSSCDGYTANSCERGQVWVSESALQKNTGAVFWLE